MDQSLNKVLQSINLFIFKLKPNRMELKKIGSYNFSDKSNGPIYIFEIFKLGVYRNSKIYLKLYQTKRFTYLLKVSK